MAQQRNKNKQKSRRPGRNAAGGQGRFKSVTSGRKDDKSSVFDKLKGLVK